MAPPLTHAAALETSWYWAVQLSPKCPQYFLQLSMYTPFRVFFLKYVSHLVVSSWQIFGVMSSWVTLWSLHSPELPGAFVVGVAVVGCAVTGAFVVGVAVDGAAVVVVVSTLQYFRPCDGVPWVHVPACNLQ